MPLINFGSILGFAEEIEKQHLDFCTRAGRNAACESSHALLEVLAKSAGKRIREVQRVRRENVTEMILETIEGFERSPFVISISMESVASMPAAEVMEKALALTDRSIDYYAQASKRLKGQAEVSLALKTLGKKHGKERKKIAES